MHVEPTFPFGRPQNVQGANPVWIDAGAQSEQHFQAERVHHQNLRIVSKIYKKDIYIYICILDKCDTMWHIWIMLFLPRTKQSDVLSTCRNIGQHLCMNAVKFHCFATLSIDQIPSAHLSAFAAADDKILLHHNAGSTETHYRSRMSNQQASWSHLY